MSALNSETPKEGRAWTAAAIAAVVLYFCFFSRLGAFGMIGPDEPRYASVARAMAETGDWVTPRLDGQPWFEKPILYYWSAAAAFRVFGASDAAARLPSAVFALLVALALAWLARRIYGEGTSWAVLLIFPTGVGVFAFARAATTDMPFSGSLALAMIAAYRVLWSEELREQGRWQALFGVLLGVAALAKGPAAPALAAGSVGVWAVVTRQWSRALRLAHPLAVLAFCAVTLPWYVLCSLRNPEFLGVFLLAHNVERFLTPLFQHEQSLWFYGPILLLGLLPWSALLAGTARDALALWRDKKLRESPGVFFACWALFPLVFFSVSRSKLPGYILPVFAPLALLLARSLTRAIEQNDSFAQWLMEWTGVTLLLLAAVTGYRLSKLPTLLGAMPRTEMAAWIAAITLGGLIVSGLGWAQKYRASLALAALVIAATVTAINFRVAPQIDRVLSVRTAARLAQAEARPGEAIRAFRLHRAWQSGLNYYLHGEVAEWKPASWGERPAVVVTSDAGVQTLQAWQVQFRIVHRVSPQAVIIRP